MLRGYLKRVDLLMLLLTATPLVAQVEIELVSPSTSSAVFSGLLSENGRWVCWDGYLYDRTNKTNVLYGHQAGAPTTPANSFVSPRAPTPDGRFIVYNTYATDVASGVIDTNGATDAYLYDRNVASALLISHVAGSPSQAADNETYSVWMSTNTRQFVLESRSQQLLNGMTGPAGIPNLFFHDRITGNTELISHSHLSLTESGDQESSFHTISADQRFIYYSSAAFNLIPGFVDRNDFETSPLEGDGRGGIPVYVMDLYVYDRDLQQSTLVSHRALFPNEGTSGSVGGPLPLPDQSGAYFSALGDDLVAGQTPAPSQRKIFFWNRKTNTNELVTHALGQPLTPCDGSTSLSDMSADGRYLLVTSTCKLTGGEGARTQEVFVIDRIAEQTQLITHVPGDPNTPLGLLSSAIDLSDDGRRVTFSIFDEPGHLGPYPYSYDRQTGIRTALSPTWLDPSTTARANVRSISADGNMVLLNSTSNELAPGDTDGLDDIYLAILSNLFADGFESASTAAWSQTLP